MNKDFKFECQPNKKGFKVHREGWVFKDSGYYFDGYYTFKDNPRRFHGSFVNYDGSDEDGNAVSEYGFYFNGRVYGQCIYEPCLDNLEELN